MSEKILAHSNETGAYTRLLRFDAGFESSEVLVHDFYEEVYILQGSIIDKRLGRSFRQGMYAFRNPGMKHGPYHSPEGCLTIEFRYFGLKGRGQ